MACSRLRSALTSRRVLLPLFCFVGIPLLIVEGFLIRQCNGEEGARFLEHEQFATECIASKTTQWKYPTMCKNTFEFLGGHSLSEEITRCVVATNRRVAFTFLDASGTLQIATFMSGYGILRLVDWLMKLAPLLG